MSEAMAMGQRLPWRNYDIPDAFAPSSRRDDGGGIGEDRIPSAPGRDRAYYGPGELEAYCHALLRRDAGAAKLRVWYPGRWHRHSPRARFRARIDRGRPQETAGGDGGDSGLLAFRSNARIASADLVEVSDSGAETGRALRARSTVQMVGDGGVYDHALLPPPGGGAALEVEDAGGLRSYVVLELDARAPPLSGNGNPMHARGRDNGVDASQSRIEVETIDAPPCVIPCHQQQTLEWEWKGDLDEWVPISSCWTSCMNSHQQLRDLAPSDEEAFGSEEQSEALFPPFPHQMEFFKISIIRPERQLYRVGGFALSLGDVSSQKTIAYDFGRELLGKVHLSIAGSSHSKMSPPLAPKIRVGETPEEAMNEEEEYFEQCLELCSDTSISYCTSEQTMQGWVSCHLLAFRYVSVIVPLDCPTDNVAITCHAHMPYLEQFGTFSSSNGSIDVDSVGQMHQRQHVAERDGEIWKCAAYTLQLCIHNNFIVDGIKRDRLPWAGDLAVSIMANAYTFRNEECVRWTLAVLGRCGIDKLRGIQKGNGGSHKGVDGIRVVISDSHVNCCVDYSLWFIISHWLYQRYFEDIHFLKQEWRPIALRLQCLLKWSTDHDGNLIVQNGEWVFIDWNFLEDSKSFALKILWWHTIECGISLAQKMVDTMNEHSERKSLDILISQLNETKTRLEDSFIKMKECDDSRHAHILGLFSGLYTCLDARASKGDWSNPNSSDDRWQTIRWCRSLHDRSLEALMENKLAPVATPYMKHLECLVLCRLGERISALERVQSYWGGMLDTNATTFFEAFDLNESSFHQMYDRSFGRSLCHAWAAGPCALYPEMVLGVRPLSDGWEQWVCDPIECSALVCAQIPTKFGMINFRLDANSLEVCVPAGTTMSVMGRMYRCGSHCFSRQSLISQQAVREWSKKYRGWQHHADYVIRPNPMISGYEGIQMTDVPTIYQIPEDDSYYMSFIGFDGIGYQTFVAESVDLIQWNNIRLAMGYGEEGMFDYGGVVLGAFLLEGYGVAAPRLLKKKNGKFYCLYGAYAKRDAYEPDPGYQGLASSENGKIWKREKDESILSVYGPGTVKDWEKDSIYQPWLVEHNGEYYNFYNAKQMPQWIEQMGLATSKNLYDWKRHEDNPILSVGKAMDTGTICGFDTQFTSDAKVFYDPEHFHWVMFYFGVGKGGAHIMVAFSRDLLLWVRDPTPLYTAGSNPSGLDKQYAHKVSLLWNPRNETWYMFYCAVGDAGRGIGLITSRSI